MASDETIETPSRWALVTALSPIVIWFVLSSMAPGFTDPLYQNPPGLFGLPAGLLLVGIALVLAVVGAVVVWRSRSSATTALAIGFLTIPALLIIGLGPPIIQAVQDIAV